MSFHASTRPAARALASISVGFIGAGLFAACGGGSDGPIVSSTPDGGSALADAAPVSDGAPYVQPTFDAATPITSSSGDDCSDAAKLVYVIDQNGTLASFTPSTLTFKDVGKVSCASTGSPYSMSVDRQGAAWVVYDTGEMFKVSTTDASCTPIARPAGDQGFTTFGMGFVAPGGDASKDTLFIAGMPPLSLSLDTFKTFLGTITPVSLTTTRVGPLPDALPELSGTGDGKLWAFYVQSTPPTVAQLDLGDAHTLVSHDLASVDTSGVTGYAFAFWGGDFWLFVAGAGAADTTVWQVDGSTFAQKAALSNTGRKIVGAGVSTCAPLILR